MARFLEMPSNQAARRAIQLVLDALLTNAEHRLPPIILVHGPRGCGKTHLVCGLMRELTRHRPELPLYHAQAHECTRPEHVGVSVAGGSRPAETVSLWCDAAREARLFVLEDVQYLPPAQAECLVQLLDARAARSLLTLVTSNFGPRQLATRGNSLPARLLSRLAAGLVTAIEMPTAAERLLLLEELAQRRQLAAPPDVLRWLADHLPNGGRHLEGAIAQLETVTKLRRRPPDLAEVRQHFHEQLRAMAPTVDKIIRRVAGYFHVDPREVASRRRARALLVPRQVGMYLARCLTPLSLAQIGEAFGGQDHSTVLHACRKIRQASSRDGILAGAVRQLQLELA
ncbi:MAG: DnaA/Hda family protein [Gemmataceae bacterium]|nr:DnaA/Hda family protein [Gemmataceae bacterium]